MPTPPLTKKMGPPFLPPADRRTARVASTLKPGEHARVEALALSRGATISDTVRYLVLAALERSDKARIELDAESCCCNAQAERWKRELVDALEEIRGHSAYTFEKHYGALAVELGIAHTFVYFPPASEEKTP